MSRHDTSTRVLLAGTLVSLVVHAGAVEGFVRFGNMRLHADPRAPAAPKYERPPELQRPAPPPPQRDVVVHLGIEHSEAAATMTWLGADSPTEHLAPQRAVEQSALSPEPGPGGKPVAVAPSSEVAAPETPAAPAQPATPAQAMAAPTPAAAAPPPQAAKSEAADSIAKFGKRLGDAIREIAREEQRRAQESRPPSPEAPAAESKPVAAAPAPPPAPPSPPPARPSAQPGGGAPGLKSHAESDASAIKASERISPGAVVAAQGLEIATRRPRWSNTTLLTRYPRNPVIVIEFGRDGKVKSADFALAGGRRYSTGYDDVDEPLLNAVYSWTATGEPLTKLPADNPEATVRVILTILLG
jgi:hypothetical protein